ncbi:carboxylic acid reductase [Nocardia stercoris]|uniref:Carboxylic acid reductase n=1 Tax=Nocardia stercoris TaxID=2483361 RepID=A0A3M2L4P9_9NOCA|nr:carboxylic acid reductase [Nocardia stercoris]RMI29498.1 NAD-dependent epimerase/dehydratase family protein [Nocardia stercoris]
MIEDKRAARARRIAELFADERLRAAAPDMAVIEALRTSTLRLVELVDVVMTSYATRPACAERATESVVDGSGRRSRRLLPGYRTISYAELWARAGAVAAAWQHDDLAPVAPGDFVATLGFTSADYTAIDLACLRAGAVSVPMPTTVPVAQWNSILAETGARIWLVSLESLRAAAEGLQADSPVRTMVVFDYHPDDDGDREVVEAARRALVASGAQVRLTTLEALVVRGRELPAPLVVSDDPDPLHLLMYTSGSTGTPKGAMYTERLAAGFWRGAGTFTQSSRALSPAIGLHYMPLGHLMGRGVLLGALARGGTAYFSAGSDVSTLLEDTALVRPVELFLVPRVCDLLYQRYLGEVDRRIAVGTDPATAAAEALAEVRDRVLGGRVVTTMCGSAPLTTAMRQFMERLLGIDMHDGYGSTEAGGRIMLDNRIRRPPVLEYKLVDVPELGYFATDRPHPRGELLLKSTLMIPGYFKRPELTEQIFDSDGFYRTGDIVAEIEPDHLVYVDRRNSVLKLAQGEFVAVNRLEALFVAAPSVRQIYLYGNSERSYLVAVVVPTPQALAARITKGEIAVELRGIAHEAELNSYEIPRDFLIEPEPFTAAGGLLSSMGKPLRPKLAERYRERLEQLYADLDRRRSEQLAELAREAESRPVLATVCRAAEVLLGTTALPDQQFTDLGGDSLAALSFSQLLHEIFGVSVPVGAITGPDTDLRRIAAYVVAEQNTADHRPTVASVHGLGSRLVAAHLLLDKFLDPATLAIAPTLPRAPHPPRTVLLTGANGYLGRFLTLELLRQLDPAGTLICLVRGRDAESARARLDAAFDDGAALHADFRIDAAGRLRVVAGDVSAPNFGLPESDWQELTESVDLVVHAAALVNHVLPYAQLFGPNVVGTAEVIRFALTTTIKPIAFLSTVAVAGQAGRDAFDEDGDIRRVSPVRAIDAGYASGYGNSKWAGEVMLREAHELCGLPVTVFRSDMILAHPDYPGQFNAGDMFSRLLFSVLATGLAPSSFYLSDPAGGRRSAHYDGLPVDFTAAAITTLSLAIDTGFRTYDVLNPHDDDISLDTFVDWLIEAGEPIERIDGFDNWSDRFETALRALPDKQRQQSVLPLLHAFRRPTQPLPGSLLPAGKFRAAVQEAGVGPTGDIPHLTRELILKYAADIRLRGML